MLKKKLPRGITSIILLLWTSLACAQMGTTCRFELTDSLLVIDLNEKAWKHKSNNPSLALRLTEHALHVAQDIRYAAGEASAMHTRAMILWYQGRVDSATQLFFSALEIRDSLGDKLGLSRSYNNIGNAFFEQAKYDEAFKYYHAGLSMRQQIKDSSGLVYSYSNIGDVFYKLQQYTQASESYHKGLALSRKLHFDDGTAYVAGQLGELAQSRGMPDSARFYYNYELTLAEQSQHKNQISRSLMHLIQMELETAQPNLNWCAKEAERALLLANEIGALDIETELSRLLAGVYARMGKFEKAYLIHQDYVSLQMREAQLSSEKSLLEAKMKYQIAQEEKKKEQIERDRERKVFLYSFIIGLLVVGILVLSLHYARSRIKHQRSVQDLMEDKNQQMERHNQILLHKNQALEQFMFAVSHDLKEPLRNISSFAGLLERRFKEHLGRDGQVYINYIVSGVHQMYKLLEDTLVFSHLARQDEVKWEKTNLNEVMDDVARSLHDTIQKYQAQLHVMDLPVVSTQPARIKQLYINLIGNALKFRRAVPPVIQVGYELRQDCHLFWVKDNGIGIEGAFFDKIFLPFHRLNRQDYEGTGLGLAICRQIIQQQGGRLWVESQLGYGSTFYFTLPLTRTSLAPRSQTTAVSLVN